MPKEEDREDEDWCFICKDGGELLLCDKQNCFKAYHPECVDKDDSVLTSNKRWICKWHSCLVCKRASNFHCYCCPNAVCVQCIKKARFVRAKEKYGFCNDCLKLAVLVEENRDVDSDGESVNLKDRETYEGLFREYYEIIKEKEGFNADTVCTAKSQLDMENSDQSASDFNETDGGEDDPQFSSDSDENPNGRRRRKRQKGNKKSKIQKNISQKKTPKKLVFVSWGSEDLIWFLKSVGENTSEELSLDDVERIILRYVKENKLSHPAKKRKVICDSKLRAILKRKEVNKNSIPKLLECHFAKFQDESEDDEICNEVEDGDEKGMVTSEVERKQKRDNNKDKSDNNRQKPDNDKQKPDNDKHKPDNDIVKKEVLVNIPSSCYAAIIPENIKLVYLKKSLVEELCKEPQAFENKVLGSFVRVKSNPSDTRRSCSFQLEQVTGTRSAPVGEENSEILLRVSNMPHDIGLSMLSDGNFSEEECGVLLQKVKDGLLKKPTVEELQVKARILHVDITNHWIPRELARLQNLINLSNEKGWRREKYEYLNTRKKLENPSEVSQLLQILPVVIPDSGELDDPSDINSERKENVTSQELAPSTVAKDEKELGETGQPLQSTENKELNTSMPCQQEELQTQSHNLPSVDHLEEVLPSDENNDGLKTESISMAAMTELGDDFKLDTEDSRKQTIAEVIEYNGKKRNQHTNVEPETEKRHKIGMADMVKYNDNEKAEVAMEDPNELVWNISGMYQDDEKHNLSFLKKWSETYAQAFDFKVWKEGQCEDNAIPLRDALKLAFPKYF